MKFITYGIHTRLHYLLKRINGIDEKRRIDYLHDLYKIPKDVLTRINLYDIEDLVKTNTIDEVVFMLESEVKNKSKYTGFQGLDYLTTLFDHDMMLKFWNFSRNCNSRYL